MPDKRKFLRVPAACIVSVREVEKSEEWSLTSNLALKDISLTGLSFHSLHSYPVGTILALELSLAGWEQVRTEVCPGEKHEKLALAGEVVRMEAVRQGGWEVGIYFVSIDEWDRLALYEYLKRKGPPSK